MKRSYQHDHTKAWSKTIAEADAFAFVMPEYNYGMPPAMLNAIDYLYFEWCYNPAGFVSYGGASGGVRSVQMAKPVLTSVKVMPIPEGVALPFFAKQIDDQGRARAPARPPRRPPPRCLTSWRAGRPPSRRSALRRGVSASRDEAEELPRSSRVDRRPAHRPSVGRGARDERRAPLGEHPLRQVDVVLEADPRVPAAADGELAHRLLVATDRGERPGGSGRQERAG